MKKYITYLNTDTLKYQFLDNFRLDNNLTNEKLELFKEIILSINNSNYICKLLFTTNIVYLKSNTDMDLDFFSKLIDKINEQKILVDAYYNIDNNYNNFILKETEELILKKLDQEHIKLIIQRTPEYFGRYNILKYIEDDSFLLEAIEHYNFRVKYSDDMLPIFKRFAEKKNLNLEYLIKLAKITNCNILRSFNDNIMKAVNLDEESFEKYIKLFNDNNCQMDKSALSTVLSSILQKNSV